MFKIEKNHPCYDCYYYDEESGFCCSHEGCIRADDQNLDLE
jgi:hypothetical protein